MLSCYNTIYQTKDYLVYLFRSIQWYIDHCNGGLPCVASTATLKSGPGFLSSRAVRRCILSFSASSSRVCIQPWSRIMRRRDLRWRTIAPIIPDKNHHHNIITEIHNSNDSQFVSTILRTHEIDRTYTPGTPATVSR